MNYNSGQELKVGDTVRLGDDKNGKVVFSVDADEYTENYPKEEWSYLERGAMINFPKYGMIHYVECDPDLELVSRA